MSGRAGGSTWERLGEGRPRAKNPQQKARHQRGGGSSREAATEIRARVAWTSLQAITLRATHASPLPWKKKRGRRTDFWPVPSGLVGSDRTFRLLGVVGRNATFSSSHPVSEVGEIGLVDGREVRDPAHAPAAGEVGLGIEMPGEIAFGMVYP